MTATRTLACHQPLFLPYLGFFERLTRCDVFVVRDDTQFAKRNFIHRNRIRVPGPEPKPKWLTVPVDKSAVPIHKVSIKNEVMVKRRSWQRDIGFQLQGCYSSTPYFRAYYGPIMEILEGGHERLVELNMALIKQFCEWFQIQVPIIRATQVEGFSPTGDASEDLALLAQLTDCQTYLSGDGASVYIQAEPFERRKVNLTFQEYKHPSYSQQGMDFMPYLASLDALFHIGRFPQHGDGEK